jgi:uncharacterized membrane protein
MPEPWRTVLEVLLTALFGLNAVMLSGLLRRVSKMETNLTNHETLQAENMLATDEKIAKMRSNYVDRFGEVNKNIFLMKEELLRELGAINVAIARLQTFNERE